MFYEFNSNKIFRSQNTDCPCGHAYIGCIACDLKKQKIYCSENNIYNSDLNRHFKNQIPKVIHAEENTVHKLKTSEKNKPIDIIVFRTDKKGNDLLMSKSCDNCKNIMNKVLLSKNWKPRNLFFTNDIGEICKDTWNVT